MAIQVYEATHDGQGNSLPATSRQFISFSYGGRDIEEFGLLVVFPNDRLEKNITADFVDITSNNEGVDGQIYWGSYFKPGYLNFTLATDGMTSLQYEDFKTYFKEGDIRELALTEFPNRYSKARVSAAPSLSLVPFEDTSTVYIGGVAWETRTTLYKGKIQVSFVMDDPFWYAKESYINKTSNYTEDELRIVLEDNIPTSGMFSENFRCLLAEGKIYDGSTITENNGVTLVSSSPLYYYNCGTTYAQPSLSFSVGLVKSGNYCYLGNATNKLTLTVGSNSFSLTTPSLITSYNTAIDIINNDGVVNGIDLLELREEIRDKLYNYYTRAQAISLIETAIESDMYGVSNGALTDAATFKSYFNDAMSSFLPPLLNLSIDNKTGVSTYTATVKNNLTSKTITENAGDMVVSNYLKIEGNSKPSARGLISSAECLKIISNCSLYSFKMNYSYTYS